jgi:hypothetical protein
VLAFAWEQKKLVSMRLGACGSPNTSGLAPPAVAPCDNVPIRYAHAITNYMPI